MLVIVAAFAIPTIAGMWKTFTKSGRHGWAAIVPFYNTYVVVDIVGRPMWWFGVIVAANLLGGIIPFVGLVSFVMWVILSIDMAKSFNKTTGFGVGLAFLPFIFYPILGFGQARYLGPSASSGASGAGQPYAGQPYGAQQYGSSPYGAPGYKPQPGVDPYAAPQPYVATPPPQAPPVTAIPAGWYQDPSAPGRQRWWDGTSWTDQTS